MGIYLGNVKCDSSGYYMPSARNGASMTTAMPNMPHMFQNVNPNLIGNSVGAFGDTNSTVNTTNIGNQKAGTSADDAICLDSP